jgi:excinuclease ABC subunit A
VEGLEDIKESSTARYLFTNKDGANKQVLREPSAWLKLADIERNNIQGLSAEFPLGVLTSVTGVSGSGKSSLVSQALVELVNEALGKEMVTETPTDEAGLLEQEFEAPTGGRIVSGMDKVSRLVNINQKAIGRTPRSNLATYTGLCRPLLI